MEKRKAKSGEKKIRKQPARESDKFPTDIQSALIAYRALFNLVPAVGMISSLHDGKIIDVNDYFLKAMGGKAEDWIGKSTLDTSFWSSSQREEFLKALSITGKITDYSISVMGPDKLLHHLKIAAEKLKIKNFECILITVLDVTPHLNVEKKLRDAETRYGNMINNARVGVYITDLEGEIEYSNEAFAKMLGYDTSEEFLANKAGSSYKNPEDRKKVINEILQNKVLHNYEVELKTKNGELVNVLLSSFLEENIISGIAVNITDRKAFEQELLQEEHRFRELADLLPEVVYESDNDANITFINKVGIEKFGYSEDRLYSNFKIFDFVVPDDRNRLLESRKLTFEKREVHRYEFTGYKKNGSVFPVIIHAVPIIKHDKVTGTRGLIIDISEQKNTEYSLRMNELRLNAILQLGQMTDMPLRDISNFAMTKAIEITGSEFGYLAFTNKEENTLTMQAWSDNIHEGFIDKNSFPVFSISSRGPWGEVLKQRKPVIINTINQEHGKDGGVPPGHAGVRRHLNIPVFDGSHLAAVLGLANKPDDYDQLDVQQLLPLMDSFIKILKRKQAEESLRKSEVLFNTTINSIRDWIHIVDDNLKFLYMNNAMLEINRELGFELDIYGKTLSEVLPFLDEKVIGEYHTIFSSGQLMYTEETTHFKDRTVTTETRKWPVLDDFGKVIRVVTVVRDITDRKTTEDKLKIFAQTIHSANDSINIAGLDNKITYVNKAFCDLYGYEPEEVIGKGSEIFWSPVNVPEYTEQILPETLKHGWEGELYNRRKDGSDIIIHLSTSAIRDGRDKPIALVGIARDITDQKRVEETIRDSEERYRAVVENTGEGVSVVDEDEVILYSNRAAELIFQLESGTLVGRSLEEFTDKDVFKTLHEQTELRRLGVSNSYEHDIITGKGNRRTLIVTATPRFNKNKVFSGTFAVFRDITDRKVFEREIINAKDKAEESDRLKSAFLANMSHEIRTPLNGILGFASIMKNDVSIVGKNQHYLDIINESGNQLLKLINDIIDISKIESGQLQIVTHECELNALLFETYSFFDNFRINNKKSHISLGVNPGLEDMESFILTDEFRLRQVLTNLVGNAIKFTSEGSVEFGYEKSDNGMLQFYVKDSGIGMSSEQLNIIFERFRQGDESTSRRYGGTGLGLAITKELIDLMGGTIWVESEPKRGSVFRFTLPYKSSGLKHIQQGKFAEKGLNYDWTGKTILIAEDVDASFLFLKILLKKTNVNVLHARDGREALEEIKSNQDIDVVLLDIQLPVISGYEVVKSVRKFNKDITVIAQTANAFEEDKSKCFSAGCNNYITKPINKDKLLEMLDLYLEGKKKN